MMSLNRHFPRKFIFLTDRSTTILDRVPPRAVVRYHACRLELFPAGADYPFTRLVLMFVCQRATRGHCFTRATM